MWRGLGASHVSVSTGRIGAGPQAHIERLRQVRQVLA
jgi:hypothetical protein